MTEINKPVTWNEAVRLAFERGVEKSDARLLLMHAAGVGSDGLLSHMDEIVPADVLRRFDALLKKRLDHLPVQYITRESCFCGIDLYVDENVLIPRPETELLAEQVFRDCEGLRVLDLCTGSGCIAVAVTLLGSPAYVAAADISGEALKVAKRNAEKTGAKVEFFCGDLFEAVKGMKFDIIVSNPPYIATDVIETLDPEVRDTEPRLALDGEADGLAFYRRIAKGCGEHLAHDGRLYLEIGEDQGVTVPAILAAEGFEDITVKKDYSGFDRIVTARYRG